MVTLQKLQHPESGERIIIENNTLKIPDNPIIPFIEGDGIGPDIWKTTKIVLDAAVEKAYSGAKKIEWFEIYAGEKASERYNNYLPQDTLEAIKYYVVAIKGPLTTPVGGGFRSLNVSLRQLLNLYTCIRPVRYYKGTPSPVKHPEKLDIVIFRENTEDVYAGIEWQEGSPEVAQVLKFLNDTMGTSIRTDSGIGIKPISITGSNQLVRKAINYAIENKKKSVTLVHKGNIQKFTEGAFRDWGYKLAAEEFGDVTIPEDELWKKYDGKVPEGKIVINDRIADSIFQQVLIRPDEYEILATTNLNGDYLSDACAAQVGGLGMAPGANIGDHIGLFEATHGTAPKYSGQDKVNPSSMILSGALMLEYLGWEEARDNIYKGLGKTIMNKTVTYDLARQMEDAKLLKCSEYGLEIVKNM